MITLDQEVAATPNQRLIEWMLDHAVGTAKLSRLTNINLEVLGLIVSGQLDPPLTLCKAIVEACREVDPMVDLADLFAR